MGVGKYDDRGYDAIQEASQEAWKAKLNESCADCGGPLFLHPSIGGVCAAFQPEDAE